jgi:hypothetical protein
LGTTLVSGLSRVPLPATGISALPIMILRLTANRFGPFPELGAGKDRSKYPKDYKASQQCRSGISVPAYSQRHSGIRRWPCPPPLSIARSVGVGLLPAWQCRSAAAVSNPFGIFIHALETNIRVRTTSTWMRNSCKAPGGCESGPTRRSGSKNFPRKGGRNRELCLKLTGMTVKSQRPEKESAPDSRASLLHAADRIHSG